MKMIPSWQSALLDPVGALQDSCDWVEQWYLWSPLLACWVSGITLRVEMRRWQRKRKTAEADVYGCAAVQYEPAGGVSGGMLIGLLGAEPRQINSTERIMAWADIRPPSPTLTNTHSHLTAHKARGVGWRERGTIWDYACVWHGSYKRKSEVKARQGYREDQYKLLRKRSCITAELDVCDWCDSCKTHIVPLGCLS